jgi:hypothetical protein
MRLIFTPQAKSRIILMVCDNGPLFSSIDSGMSWNLINAPGTHQFPLISRAGDGAFIAEATIHATNEHQPLTNISSSTWYATGSASDGSKQVLTRDASQPAPALSIAHSDAGIIVSWSEIFKNFVLQSNNDLNSTNWTDVTSAVNVVSGPNQVLVVSPAALNFFHLRSQGH